MSLHDVPDAFLAARAAAGESAAFAELARRYQPLIWNVARDGTVGLEREDARQEALIGLFIACVKHDPSRARFARFASVCVRSHVHAARTAARGRKHQFLNEAVHDADDPTRQLAERIAAGAGSEPALVVELRDELRERAERARRPQAFGRDLRSRYSDDQVNRALALIAAGKTPKEAAWAVGAPSARVRQWVNRAGMPRAGRRRFTATEIRQAVSLVHAGASLRKAGAAVGASSPTVLRSVHRVA